MPIATVVVDVAAIPARRVPQTSNILFDIAPRTAPYLPVRFDLSTYMYAIYFPLTWSDHITSLIFASLTALTVSVTIPGNPAYWQIFSGLRSFVEEPAHNRCSGWPLWQSCSYRHRLNPFRLIVGPFQLSHSTPFHRKIEVGRKSC